MYGGVRSQESDFRVNRVERSLVNGEGKKNSVYVYVGG